MVLPILSAALARSAAETPVLRRRDIAQFLANAPRDETAEKVSLAKFISHLVESGQLRRVKVDLPHRPETLYAVEGVSVYCIASALKPNAYLSHYSAMYLNELTDQVPKTIYVNHEQRPQPRPPVAPTQESIDRAFKGRQRMTTNVAELDGYQVCVLNGKNTGNLGVIDGTDSAGFPLRLTSLERTLIDITVRPAYSGGVGEVIEAFRRASDRVRVNKLVAMLNKMDFVYPYHQAIGFYLERSGAYSDTLMKLLRRKPFEFDFYLTYGMKQPAYSERWRLYHPAGL